MPLLGTKKSKTSIVSYHDLVAPLSVHDRSGDNASSVVPLNLGWAVLVARTTTPRSKAYKISVVNLHATINLAEL
jgi:hypothetical protein